MEDEITKQELVKGDIVYTTGAYLEYAGDGKFVVNAFEDDTFFDGKIVEDIENNPYIELEEI